MFYEQIWLTKVSLLLLENGRKVISSLPCETEQLELVLDSRNKKTGQCARLWANVTHDS
jgi:hypothetical protein